MLAAVTMNPVPDRADLKVVAEAERVVVRLWHPDDADRLFDIHSRTEVMKWLDQIPMRNREDALERIEAWNLTAAPNLGLGMWAVVERHSLVPAGTVFMQVLPDGAGEVEIGWYLHPDSWGRGFASAAAAITSSSVACGHPYRMLSRSVPAKRKLSCKTIPIFCRLEGSITARMSRPSIRISLSLVRVAFESRFFRLNRTPSSTFSRLPRVYICFRTRPGISMRVTSRGSCVERGSLS